LSLRLLDCATRNVNRCRTEIFILTRTKNGFQRLAWYTSDDSKHCDKISKHVLILSAQGSDVSPQSEYPDPSFNLLTTSFAAKKNSAGNAKLNLDTLKGKFSLIVLVGHFVGRVTDNANDALDETVQTSNLLMNELRNSDNPERKRMTHAFGVERRPIKFLGGVPFHVDSLVMTHASNLGSFGETDRENNSKNIIDNYCSRCMVFTVPTMMLLGSCGTVLMHNKFFGNRSLDDDTSDKEADMEATA
jgi:hypothetical protein